MIKKEADVCVIGGGISAALLAQKLAERRPGIRIQIVEAGKKFFDFDQRYAQRRRFLEYGENAWPGDAIPELAAEGVVSRTMALGGSALHWGGTCNRFSQEDLRLKSRYGLAVDWPIEWAELERYTCEAERRLGVSGEPGPFPEDKRSEPYPMKPMALGYNLRQLKEHSEKSGIPFWGTPQAKNTEKYDGRVACIRCNTCSICPTGARFSPDFVLKTLQNAGKISIDDHVLVRKLVLAEGKTTVAAAHAVNRLKPDEEIEYRARLFVLASGYCWSPHLLLASGLANRSGLVGRYMTGHLWVTAQMEVPYLIYPGVIESHALLSRQYFRCPTDKPYVRHDLRIWESSVGRDPRLRNDHGKMLFGDDMMADWKARATARGTARLRAYFDTHPDRESRLTIKNDGLPKIEHRLDPAAQGRLAATKKHIAGVFEQLAKANGGRLLSVADGEYQDHPAGGCRMGTDPSESVTDSYGRTHDHQNLYVVGAPTLPTGGCTNGTLTFSALTLRSADRIASEWK